jgi:cytochrome P450
MAKKVPPDGDTINGMYVPGGTRIGYGGFSILRNKKIWGEDADVFRPERWLEGEKIKDLELTWEVIFNAGRYQCLGKNVALMELNKVFVEVSLSSSDSCAANNCLLMLSDPEAAPVFRIQLG